MTSKGRNQLVSHDEAKLRHDAIEPEATGGGRGSIRHETSDLRATQREVAGYIEGLTAGLRAMAHSVDLDSLAYFLEMARLEASIQGERLARSGGGTSADY